MQATRKYECFTPSNKRTRQCQGGAFLMLFSWICVGMWLTIEWAYFANTLRKPVNKHISHFCVKTAGAVYSASIGLFIIFTIVYYSSISEKQEIKGNYTSSTPKVGSGPLVNIVTIILGAFMCLIIGFSTFCYLRIFKYQVKSMPVTKIQKAKRQIKRLGASTITLAVTTSPFIILWNIDLKYQKQLYPAIIAASSLMNALQGIGIAFFSAFHRDEGKKIKRLAKSGSKTSGTSNFVNRLSGRESSNVDYYGNSPEVNVERFSGLSNGKQNDEELQITTNV